MRNNETGCILFLPVICGIFSSGGTDLRRFSALPAPVAPLVARPEPAGAGKKGYTGDDGYNGEGYPLQDIHLL
ncbi:MAG: hypothetical protein EOM17_14140 [Synergistales bacterium]|nr:hypothetical protein [Synergistaceae bacterium]MDD4021421.1 hypothetical protein [Synergistaceae bacterium]NCC58747.1 hypothetical protein [Synergistales bacterium]